MGVFNGNPKGGCLLTCCKVVGRNYFDLTGCCVRNVLRIHFTPGFRLLVEFKGSKLFDSLNSAGRRSGGSIRHLNISCELSEIFGGLFKFFF